MNINLLSLLAGICISFNTFAGGFDCPSLKTKIEIIQDQGKAYLMKNNVSLPMGSEIDPFQARWGIYNTLLAQAQLSFPYMPEIILMYHLSASTKLYREGFKQVDDLGSTQYTRLPKMYCKALIEAIDHYTE